MKSNGLWAVAKGAVRLSLAAASGGTSEIIMALAFTAYDSARYAHAKQK
jgi:hypothetical protein